MNKKYPVYVVIAIVALLLLWGFSSYNALVKKDEKVRLQWSEVQNAYQRRLDLIPNLVSTVRGGADFEQSVLREVTEARSRAATLNANDASESAEKYDEISQVQDNLASSANRLLVAIERYPDIKGTKAFTTLQTQLARTELRIKLARKDFNEAVANYNQQVKRFPGSLVAGIGGFPAREGFQSQAGAENTVEIKF